MMVDRWVKRYGANLVAGGSPWRLVRLAPATASTMDKAARGLPVPPDAAARALVERGLLHPRPAARPGPHDVTVVIPVYGRADALGRCLQSLRGLDIIVVDDGTPGPSPVRPVAEAAGARYLRLAENRGPAAARNAGLACASSALVAFIDSDCQAPPGWLDALVPHFDDPRVAAVAPRVQPGHDDPGLLARFERAASALDMGRHPALVRPGARLGFVPSAALVVRRGGPGFDEDLRLGEDVDLVWRLADSGRHVRYEPTVVVRHDSPGRLAAWAGRRFQYGTSAVELDRRHPGRLAPVRVSPWNLAALGLLGLGRPVAAAGVVATAAGLLARRLRRQGIGSDVAARVVAAGLSADAVAIGHALRREYWPVTALAAVAAAGPAGRRRRLGRFALGLAVVPVLVEWARERPPLDPMRFTALRLLADGAYGSGVLASSLRQRSLAPLRPYLRSAGPAKPSRRP
jgi:mycofactocin system glycosyltransferase